MTRHFTLYFFAAFDEGALLGRLRDQGWQEPGSKTARNMARIGAKLCQNVFQTIPNISFFDAEFFSPAKFFDRKFQFSLIWRGFGAATAERTSKSASSSNFALDRLILRSVRPKILGFDQNLGFPKKKSLDYGSPFPGWNWIHSLNYLIFTNFELYFVLASDLWGMAPKHFWYLFLTSVIVLLSFTSFLNN